MFRKKSLSPKLIWGLVLAMPFWGAYISDAQVCETPSNTQAILFQPCTWHIGNDAGPLRDLVADNQNYTYTEISNTAATVNSFCATSGTGVLQVGSHGSPNALLVEAYSPDSAGVAALKTSWNNLLAAGFTRQEITVIAASDTLGKLELVGIGITKKGLQNRWISNNSIIFVGACYSAWLDFSAREYFGYWTPTTGVTVKYDAKKLFSRMNGTRGNGSMRPAGVAFANGGFTGDFDYISEVNGRTTLAPRVIDAYPHDQFLANSPVGIAGYVEFDTKMKPNPPEDVLTMQIYGLEQCDCSAKLIDMVWVNDHRLEFKIDLSQCAHTCTTGLGFTVHNNSALSLKNERELDGGSIGPGGLVSGIGPNRDDFLFKNMCIGIGGKSGKSPADLWSATTPSLHAPNYPVSLNGDSIDIVEDTVIVSGSAGIAQYSMFNIKNASDFWFYNVTFITTDLIGATGIIPKDSVFFDPDTVNVFPPDDTTDILLCVAVPSGQPDGEYIGKIAVNDGYGTDSLVLIARVKEAPVITVSDSSINVIPGDTVKLIVTAQGSKGGSVKLYAGMYPFAGWIEKPTQDSLIFYFSPDTGDTNLSFDAVFYADDGVQKVGKPVIINVLPVVGVKENGMLFPTDFFTCQNYPNPFANITEIKYGLRKDVNVKLTVYNLSGQKVATLVNEHKKAGHYTVKWNGRDETGNKVATGIYFYRLDTPATGATCQYTSTKKMFFIR